jgi:Zn-dependent peptidase ImmA (M78 family)
MSRIIKVDKKVKRNYKYLRNKIDKIILKFFIHYEEKDNFIMGLSDKENKIIFLNLFLFLEKKYDDIFKTILHELLHIFYPNLSENKIEEMTVNCQEYVKNYKFNFVYNLSEFIYNKIIKIKKIDDFKRIIDNSEYIFKID